MGTRAAPRPMLAIVRNDEVAGISAESSERYRSLGSGGLLSARYSHRRGCWRSLVCLWPDAFVGVVRVMASRFGQGENMQVNARQGPRFEAIKIT